MAHEAPTHDDSALGPAEPVPQPSEEATAPQKPSKRRFGRWAFAAGGTVILLVCGAALMQVFRSDEGVAAEAGNRAIGQGSSRAGQNGSRTLATVGEAVISYDQVAKEAMSRYGAKVLEQLINRTIIEEACRKRGVTVSKAEVEREITKIAQEFGLDRDGWLRMLQQERKITPLQYKRDIIWPMLALRKLAGTEIEITEEDIQKAFVRDYGERVKVRMIMMENFRRLGNVREKAVKIIKSEKDVGQAAAEFGKLARENSIEPTSRSLDGVVPPIRRYTGPQNQNLVDAAFSLEKGELSGIIQLPSPGKTRYVLLFCEGRTEPVVPKGKLELVRDQIVERLKKEKVQKRVAHVFNDLKKSTPVHNFLTNVSTGTDDAGGAPVDPFPSPVSPAGATQSTAVPTPPTQK